MDAVEYLKEKSRMTEFCSGTICHGKCLLSFEKNSSRETCNIFEVKHPQEAVAIVEKWSKEHPHETYKSYFLKRFPNAILDGDGFPLNCKNKMFGINRGDCERHDCSCNKCWNEILPDEYKEKSE